MGDMDGCKSLGDIYENGRGGQEIDDKKSMQLYQKACSGGVGAACWKLAGYYDEGRGVERNLAEAFKFYQTACGYEDADGCFAQADMYEKGDGVKKDVAKAYELYGLACDYGSMSACAEFRRLYKDKK